MYYLRFQCCLFLCQWFWLFDVKGRPSLTDKNTPGSSAVIRETQCYTTVWNCASIRLKMGDFFNFYFYVCCKFTGIFEREGVLQKNKNTPLCWKMLFGCLFFLLSKFSLISVTCHHYRKSIFQNPPPPLLWPVCPCPCLNDFFFSIPVCGTQSCLRGFCQSSWC